MSVFKMTFFKEQRSSLRMILGSKHVGAILNVLMQNNYLSALVGVIIKVTIAAIVSCSYKQQHKVQQCMI